MENIIALLHSRGYSCVIANATGIHSFTQRGVADLYDLYSVHPEMLDGSSVADKVVGKAAAGLMVLGKVQAVYADIISTPALALLRKAGIETTFGREVPFIQNRDQSGWCPLEMRCRELSAEEIYPAVDHFVSQIRMNR